MFKFVKFLIGYVVIKVSGNNAELLINILLKRHISVWHVRRMSDNTIIFYMYADDYVRNIKSAARKSKCDVSVIKKRGLHFTFIKYSQRKALIICSLIAIILIMLSGMTVWKIEVVCDDAMTAQKAISRLNDMGIKEGSLINRINTKNVSQELLVADNTLSWVNIQKKGTILTVELKLSEEYSKTIHEIPENTPCDVVALKDCVIYKINVKAGNLVVEVGDTVSCGETLVRGIGYNNEFNNPDKGYEYESHDIHAIADVWGVVWYKSVVEVKNHVTVMKRTGRMNVHKSLLFFNKKISLPFFGEKYDHSDTVYFEKKITAMNKKELPIGLATDIEYETVLSEATLDNKQAVMYAKMFAQTEISSMIPDNAKILSTDMEYLEQEGSTFICLKVACLENVGVDYALES